MMLAKIGGDYTPFCWSSFSPRFELDVVDAGMDHMPDHNMHPDCFDGHWEMMPPPAARVPTLIPKE